MLVNDSQNNSWCTMVHTYAMTTCIANNMSGVREVIKTNSEYITCTGQNVTKIDLLENVANIFFCKDKLYDIIFKFQLCIRRQVGEDNYSAKALQMAKSMTRLGKVYEKT